MACVCGGAVIFISSFGTAAKANEEQGGIVRSPVEAKESGDKNTGNFDDGVGVIWGSNFMCNRFDTTPNASFFITSAWTHEITRLHGTIYGGLGTASPGSVVGTFDIGKGGSNAESLYWSVEVSSDGSSATIVLENFYGFQLSGSVEAWVTTTPLFHTISASAGAGGSISPSGAVSVLYGGDQSFSVTPNTGYHISSIIVNGGNQGAVSNYTFYNVLGSHTIHATFAINTYRIDFDTVTQYPTGAVSVFPSSVSPEYKTHDEAWTLSSSICTVSPSDTWDQCGWSTDSNIYSRMLVNRSFTPNPNGSPRTFGAGTGFDGTSWTAPQIQVPTWLNGANNLEVILTLYPIWAPKQNTFQFQSGTNTEIGATSGMNPSDITRFYNVTTGNFPSAAFIANSGLYMQVGWTTEGTTVGLNGVVMGFGGTVVKTATRIAIDDSYPDSHILDNAAGTPYIWYPVWVLQSNILSFNRGVDPADTTVSGSVTPHYKTPNTNFDLRGVTRYTAVGYRQIGWTTTFVIAGGAVLGRTFYDDSPDIQTANSHATYYPIWKPDEYVITYSSGAAQASQMQIKYHGEAATLKSVIFTAYGVTQVGWSNGSETYGVNTQCAVNASQTLYPVWQPGLGTAILHNVSHLPIKFVWAYDPTDAATLALPAASLMPTNFAGWFQDAALTIPILSIPPTSPPDLAFHVYAKWT